MESLRIASGKQIFTIILSFILLIALSSVVYGRGTTVNSPSMNFDGRVHKGPLSPSTEGWAVGGEDVSLTDPLPESMSPTSPNEGTIGTQITISGSNFGSIKGKVLLGNVALKILQWTDSSIECQLLKALAPGTYDVTVQPKGRPQIPFKGGFSVEPPDIGFMRPPGGSTNDQITIYGLFFGMQKGKVTLGGRAARF